MPPWNDWACATPAVNQASTDTDEYCREKLPLNSHTVLPKGNPPSRNDTAGQAHVEMTARATQNELRSNVTPIGEAHARRHLRCIARAGEIG